ncbi:MAG: TatD family hydrolase [Candidatus Aenigmatarchaeota archaeon]
MIDVHCHLEQKDYDNDRDEVVEACRKELKAVITSCAHPRDFELTMRMVDDYKGFVFASCGIHPEHVKEMSIKERDNFLDLIVKNKDKITAIGETGLDYWYIRKEVWRKKQKDLFIQMIELAKELDKPLIIHSREVFEGTIQILEGQDAKNVNFHMWGADKLVGRILQNGWNISMNTIMLRSKKHKKIVSETPLERLMLETDSPWLAPKRLLEGLDVRNTPLSIKTVAEKVSEVKNIPFEQVWKQCGENAIKFFNLDMG